MYYKYNINCPGDTTIISLFIVRKQCGLLMFRQLNVENEVLFTEDEELSGVGQGNS